MDIVTKLTESIVFSIDDNGNHIVVPGTRNGEDCTDKPVKLSQGVGGNCQFSIHGMIQAYKYITGKKRKSTIGQRIKFEGSGPLDTPFDANRVFYYRLSTIYKDFSNYPYWTSFGTFLHSCTINDQKEIFLIANDVLHPGGEPATNEIQKNVFLHMLCTAPCSGPCTKGDFYDDIFATEPNAVPVFDCPNTPNWLGQRWEANDGSRPERVIADGIGRRFNGLDYMSLFNLYALRYHPNDLYRNPETADGVQNTLWTNNRISGPSRLCPEEIGQYSIMPNYSGSALSDILWKSTDNLKIFAPTSDPTDVKYLHNAPLSYIEANYKETRQIAQNNSNGPVTATTFADKCDFLDRKPIENAVPNYSINGTFSFCPGYYTLTASADGPVPPGTTYNWTFSQINPPNVNTFTMTGSGFTLQIPNNGQQISYGDIKVEINSPCGSTVVVRSIPITICGQGLGGDGGIYAFPNPANSTVQIAFTQPDSDALTAGIPIRIVRTNSGQVVQNTTAYGTITPIDVTSLSNGLYQIQAMPAGGTIMTTSFSITR